MREARPACAWTFGAGHHPWFETDHRTLAHPRRSRNVARVKMIFVFPILSIIAVVLTCSFVLRQGLAAYREKNAIAVFALGVSLIVYFATVLGARIARLDFIGTALTRSSDLEQWVLIRQAITIIHSLLLLAFIVYLTILIRRDLGPAAAHRSRIKESVGLAALAFTFSALGLFRDL